MGWEEVTIGGCRLIRGDALAVLPTLGPIEALVTDPPYGHGWEGIASAAPGGRRWTKRRTVHLAGYQTPFDPLPWLTASQQCVFWGANHFAPKLPASGGWLVWDKREGTAENNFSDCELAWTNVSGSVRLFRYLWNGLCRAGEIGEHLHPNQKPIALMRWCIQKTSGVVVDPYAGSFTTAVACVQLGRPCVCIEIEPMYWELGCRRIEAAYDQLDLTQPDTWSAPTQLTLTGGAV